MNLVAELRRRRVFRIAAMYIIASWAVLQVADLAFISWGLPGAALRYIWIAAFLLFPVALVFAWRYDLTAAGIVRTSPADGTGNAALSLSGPDYTLLAALGVIAVLVITGTFREVANGRGIRSFAGGGKRWGCIQRVG